MGVKFDRSGSATGFITPSGQEVLTNKDIDGGVASNTNRISVPSDTKANLDALTRKAGVILYASDLQKFYIDNGSVLIELGLGDAPDLRNLIINGNFDFWQRGTTPISPTAAGGYLADRFAIFEDSGAVVEYSQSTNVPDGKSKYSLRAEVTTADASLSASDKGGIFYRMEGYDVAPLHGRSLTLSFWVRSNKTGTYSLSIRNSGADRSFVQEYSIDSADTWEYKTINIPGPDLSSGTWDLENGIGFDITWGTFADSSNAQATSTLGSWQTGDYMYSTNQVNYADTIGNYIELSQVMLNIGDAASPFIRVGGSIQDELAMCHRYCQKLESPGTAHPLGKMHRSAGDGSVWVGTLHISTELRATPTMTVSGTADIRKEDGSEENISTFSGVGAKTNLIFFNANMSVNLSGNLGFMRLSASGYFLLESEL